MHRVIPAGVHAVFFDAVHTILFPEPSAARVYAALASRHGLAISTAEVQSRFLAAFHAEEEADREAGWVTNEAREIERWRRIVIATLAGVDDPESCFRELYTHFGKPAAWRLDAHALNVLVDLAARGLAVGVGSNFDARLLSVLHGFPELRVLGPRVVISAAVGHRKPSPHFFGAVVHAAACQAGEVLFVGDDPENDYRGAANAGLQAILLDPKGRHADVNRRVGSLEQLLE